MTSDGAAGRKSSASERPFPESDLLVAVLVRPEGLTTLLSRVRTPAAPPPRPERTDPLLAWRTRYELVEAPIESTPLRLCPARDRILAAWSAIRTARWDAATRFHLRVLAIETVPVPDVRAENVMKPVGDVHPSRPAATAAHPRAYRGTIWRPPKRRRAEETDLGRLICHPKGLAEALRLLGGDRDEDLRRLARAGYDQARLALAAPHATGADFGLAYHHGEPRPAGLTLPPWFTTEVLPLLRGAPWRDVRRHLSACHDLGMGEDRELRASAVRLLAAGTPACALGWLHLAANRAPTRRATFVAIVADSVAGRTLPTDLMEKYLARLEACTSEAVYAMRLRDLLASVERGLSLDYKIEGIELAAKYWEHAELSETSSCDDYPAEEMRALTQHIEPVARLLCPGLPLVLWEAHGSLPGLADLIRETEWDRLDLYSATDLLKLLTGVTHHDVSEDARSAKWRFIRREFPRIFDQVCALPADPQDKFIASLTSYFRFWDTADELERWWPAACSISARLALPPFSDEELGTVVISYLIDTLPDGLSERALGAPDRSFLTLEKEVDRGIFGNRRMEDGIATLSRRLPALVAEGFLSFPRALFQAAKTLGSLSEPERRRVLDLFAEHPMNDPGLLGRPLHDVCDLLRRHARSGSNPVPRRLREFVEEGRGLTPGQVERHKRVLSERLLGARLDLLGDLAVEAMGRGLLLDRRHAALRHALEMLRFSHGNRRGLRRLLQAIADGRPPAEYLIRHPSTQAWLRRHPRVDAEKWTRGVSAPIQVAGLGKVGLAVEQDPLEALRLGTYVGTCLGLGQTCAYSAAAVVLDVNKQVVYARNARGRVLARQLVALSEDDRLVCFQVYPDSASDSVKSAFLEFDLRFAEALDLPFCEVLENDFPEIAHILSQEWWDDGVWDVFLR